MSGISVEKKLTDRGYRLDNSRIYLDPTGKLLRGARLRAGLSIKDMAAGMGINEEQAVSLEMTGVQIRHRRFWKRN
ncbi:hypothetical protein HYU95_02930 [Candidatus Daviesbacteria bacterium]|nr:hypothetical protein [Candidatus Daviesbacteria bacterium]